jgi:hypothetical protein
MTYYRDLSDRVYHIDDFTGIPIYVGKRELKSIDEAFILDEKDIYPPETIEA